MNRDETLHALQILGSSAAATWIGNKISDDGTRLIQKCTRCGQEEALELPADAVSAFRSGARGDALARLVPPFFDEQLFTWKRDFQQTHKGCGDNRAA
jgi:hypothetical protein